MESIKDYIAHLDSKKRITLRGARYSYYNVREYENGCILLVPREITVPDSVSEDALREMDRTVDELVY